MKSTHFLSKNMNKQTIQANFEANNQINTNCDVIALWSYTENEKKKNPFASLKPLELQENVCGIQVAGAAAPIYFRLLPAFVTI